MWAHNGFYAGGLYSADLDEVISGGSLGYLGHRLPQLRRGYTCDIQDTETVRFILSFPGKESLVFVVDDSNPIEVVLAKVRLVAG